MSTEIQIRDDHLYFNGVNYFRGQAQAVQLGDVGEKCTSDPRTHHLAVRAAVLRKNLPIHGSSLLTLKGAAIGSADIGVCADVPGLGRLGAGSVANALASGEVSLLKLSLQPERLRGLVNDGPTKALQALKAAGSGGRIVHQVWVLLPARTAAAAQAAPGLEIGTIGSATTLRICGGSGGASLTLSPGCTFAYLLLEPVWDARQAKYRTRVVDAREDPWSLY